jgi:uncharacterized protein involved in exopolysaccharide biosynthesis
VKRDEWTDTVIEGEPSTQATKPKASTLRGVLTVAFHDRRRIGLVLLLGLALTAAAAFLAPKKYTAEASLLMRLGREYIYTPEVGDNNTGGAPIAYDRDQSLQAETRILKSRDLQEAVLDKMGVAQVYPAIAASGDNPAAQHSAALLTMEKSLDADLLKGSNLMQISFEHPDPLIASKVLTQLIDAYMMRRSVIFASANYDTALADFNARKAELRAAEVRLAAVKGERKIRSFGEEQSLLLNQRNALEMRQTDMAVAEAQSSSRSAALRRNLPAVLADVTLSTETQRSDALENARKVLLDLSLKERDLSARYTDDNPLVEDARASIDSTRSFIHDLESNPTRTVRSGRSPARDAVETDLVRSLADQSQARAGDAVVAAERARVDARLQQFAVSEQQLPALERNRRLAEQNYEAAAKRLRDETALAELDRKRRSNVSVVQSPTVPLEGKSMRPAILVVGGFASLCAALLTAFLCSLWRDTFLTPEDVERRLGVKLLATVPVSAS